jgi:hypothetical protein
MASPRATAIASVGLLSVGCSASGPGGGGPPRPRPERDAGVAPDDAGLPPPSGRDAGTVSHDAGSGMGSDPCGDGLDGDGDSSIDEGCSCTPGATQRCWPGDPELRGVGACTDGMQTCVGTAEFGSFGGCTGATFPATEDCDGAADEDCDGMVNEDCGPTVVEVAVDIDGDCVTASCPPEAPYPIGCNITMDGGDERGCVASMPRSAVVYFQEGDRCGAGHVGGTLTCSSEPGAGLNEGNCRINKDVRYYPADPGGCPDTD